MSYRFAKITAVFLGYIGQATATQVDDQHGVTVFCCLVRQGLFNVSLHQISDQLIQ